VLQIVGEPVYTIMNDMINIQNGFGVTTLPNPTGLILTSGTYVRLSGSVDDTDTVIRMNSDLSTLFPPSGSVLIDPQNTRGEIIEYTDISGLDNTYISGLTKSSGLVYPTDTQVWLVVSSEVADGQISGVNGTGLHYANYISSGVSYTYNEKTGLMNVPSMSGIHRVKADINYYRGMLFSYEPSGNTDLYLDASGVDISPLAHGISHGILWTSTAPLYPASIELSTNRNVNTDGTVGPVFAGNDFLVVEAKVLSNRGAPVPQAQVTMALGANTNIGLLDGLDPADGPITKVTDGAGIARFAYTPPGDIQGLGYFVPSGNVVNSSGLQFINTVPIEELWVSGTGWKSLVFAVYSDDEYLDLSITSGLFEFTVDGAFELITRASGTSPDTGYTIFEALTPDLALDENLLPTTASGTSVQTLVFNTGSIPVADNIPAYFVSAEKRISIGAVVQDAQAASPSMNIIVGIPPFMTGEFLFGPVDEIGTSSFDSLAYISINPFENRDPGQDRLDPRTLGQVFRLQGSKSDEFLRNKFYIGLDYEALSSTITGINEIYKLHTFRNRFIIEI
jgi:hypothetical protein